MMSDLVKDLTDLHRQATLERSHYYTGKLVLAARDRITALEAELAGVRAGTHVIVPVAVLRHVGGKASQEQDK